MAEINHFSSILLGTKSTGDLFNLAIYCNIHLYAVEALTGEL